MSRAEQYAMDQLRELEHRIAECDYIEDMDGHRVYQPGAYYEEKLDLERQRRSWEMLLRMLREER